MSSIFAWIVIKFYIHVWFMSRPKIVPLFLHFLTRQGLEILHVTNMLWENIVLKMRHFLVYIFLKNKAIYTIASVACNWAGAVMWGTGVMGGAVYMTNANVEKAHV